LLEHILVFGTCGGAALPYPDMVHAGVSAGMGAGVGRGRSQDFVKNQLTFLNIYVPPPLFRFPCATQRIVPFYALLSHNK
jgi:hypothetical protein